MSEQLSLWEKSNQTRQGEALPQPLAGITWSYSRRSTMEQCVRRYYYEYFGSNKKTAMQDPNKDDLIRLKQMQNRHLRAGDIMHLVIRTYLRKAKEGTVWAADRLANWAHDLLRADVAYSTSYPNSETAPAGRYPPTLLDEFYYRNPEAPQLYSEVEQRLIGALHSFATDPLYDTFRANGAKPEALVEQRFHLDDGIACRVEGVLDLVYQSEGNIHIIDWKLGAGDGAGDDSLQLAVYAIWAVAHFGCTPDRLRICKAYLGSTTIAEFTADQVLLAAAHARIAQDVERMLIIQEYGQQGIAEAFTPCEQLGICRMCVYRGVCPEGKELVG